MLGTVIHFFHRWPQVGAVVSIDALVNLENLVAGRLLFAVIADGILDRRQQRLRNRSRIFCAAEALVTRTVERRHQVQVPGQVIGVCPPAARYVTVGPRRAAVLVPTPFPNVSDHVIGAIGGNAAVASYPGRTFAAEIAELCLYLDQQVGTGGPVPMVDRRQTLAGEFRVGCGLVPTDPAYGKVGLALRIAPELPSGGSGAASGVVKLGHRLFPGKDLPFLDKRVLPKLAPLVTASLKKLLKLPVGDLVLVQPVVFDLHCRAGTGVDDVRQARRPYQAGRRLAGEG